MRLASSTKNKKASVKKYKRYGIRVGFNFVDGEDMVFYDCSSSTSPYAMNFFQDKVKFKVSPKQLGECKTLKAIEKKLIDVVVDFDEKNERKIFEPMDMRPDLSAIKSIEDIDSIFISYKGWDKDESDDFYEATYTYYMDGSFYCGEILNPQYADKVEKVLLELSDLDACEVEETDIANDEDGDEEVEELVKQEKIKKEMEQWQKSVAMITKNRKNEKNKRLKQYDEEYRLSVDKIQRKKDMDVAEIRKRIANLEESVAQGTEELNRLGIFKFKRREELRKDIESYKKTIHDSMVRILSVENKAQEDISVEEMKCKKKVECLEGELDREFVIPESPEEIERRKMEEKRLRKQIEELSVEEKIVFEALTLCDKPVTVSELWRANYEVSLMSPSIITASLGRLTEKGIVEKHVEVKTTKFAVISHYKNLEKRV